MATHTKIQAFLQRGLKLRQLRLLLALDTHRHVSRVAQALNVTQPAVSKSLAELEQGLGLALFLRTARGLEPTAEGSCLIRHAEAVDEDLRRAAAALESIARPQVWRVALGAMHGATPLVAPAMERWRRKHGSSATFELTVQEASIDTLLPRLRSGRIDLAVGVVADGSTVADLQVTPLFVDHMAWIIGRDHPLVGRSRVSLADLQEYIWVMTPRVSRRRALVDAALRRQGAQPPLHVVETLSHEVMLGFVLHQNAAALVMSRIARSFASRGLVKVLDIEMQQMLQVSAFVRADPLPSPPALELIECMAEQAAYSAPA